MLNPVAKSAFVGSQRLVRNHTETKLDLDRNPTRGFGPGDRGGCEFCHLCHFESLSVVWLGCSECYVRSVT